MPLSLAIHLATAIASSPTSAAMAKIELKTPDAAACAAKYQSFAEGRSSPKLSPQLKARLSLIEEKIQEMHKLRMLDDSVKREVTKRINFNDAEYSLRDVKALHAVIDKLHDVAAWIEYTKQLTLDSAAYIAEKGSTAEKKILRESGEISRRSMLAVLAKRAAQRGEKVGKFEGTNRDDFFQHVHRGPFVDRGLDMNPRHGQLPHWLQMDFIAPTLEDIYGPGSREFYEKVTETYAWNVLFDRDAFHFSSPTGIRLVLGRVLPLENVGP